MRIKALLRFLLVETILSHRKSKRNRLTLIKRPLILKLTYKASHKESRNINKTSQVS